MNPITPARMYHSHFMLSLLGEDVCDDLAHYEECDDA